MENNTEVKREESPQNLIRLSGICKIYNPGENEVRALDHVDLQIDEGEFVATIGQSGSGKSTLMKYAGCLDVPTEGSYCLHGQDVSHLKDNQLSEIRNREIGFIFQGFNLIANLNALENVELPLIYRGLGKTEEKGAFPGCPEDGRSGEPYGPQALGDVRRTAAEGCHSQSYCRQAACDPGR